MGFSLDQQKIPFPCPKCGHKFNQSVRWLKTHKDLTCPSCKTPIKLDSHKLVRAFEDVGKALDKLPRKITIKL